MIPFLFLLGYSINLGYPSLGRMFGLLFRFR